MSIVNNTALSRFWEQSKYYIDSLSNALPVAQLGEVREVGGYSSSTPGRIQFTTTTNSNICTVNNGKIVFPTAGDYLIFCNGGCYTSGTQVKRYTLRLRTGGTIDTNTDGTSIGSTTLFSASTSVYNYTGSGGAVSTELFYLLTATANQAICFSLESSRTDADVTIDPNLCHATIIKLS